MFSGIVQTQGNVVSITDGENARHLVISIPARYLERLDIGASIAINGVCLTVVRYEVSPNDVVGQVYFDVIDETLRLTNLGGLQQRDKVNVERSVTFGTEIGGHIVSGHIQTTATIRSITRTAENCAMELALPPKWMKYILHKGFVAVDGASLTVGDTTRDSFMLHLIPETLEVTTLGKREEGDLINIEVDQQTYTIVNTVERYLKESRPA